MAAFKISSCLALFVLLGICNQGLAMRKREATRPVSQGDAQPQAQDKDKKPDWQPVTGTRKFSVNVDDNIQGANQHRNETWNNGVVTGTYAAPGRDGKWLKYEYIGDKDGFRITSTKEIQSEELMADQALDHQASVNIQTGDSAGVKYTVTEEQLKQKPKDKVQPAVAASS